MRRESGDAPVVPKNRRRHPRTRGSWKGRLATLDAAYDCRILDLSAAGAQVRLLADIAGPIVTLKEPVLLAIDGKGQFRGVVVWHRGNVIGLHLAEPAGANRPA